MSITAIIVVYAVTWFMVFFIVLPIRFVSQGDTGSVVPGHPAGGTGGRECAAQGLDHDGGRHGGLGDHLRHHPVGRDLGARLRFQRRDGACPCSRWNRWVKVAAPITGTSRLTTGIDSGAAISAPASQSVEAWRLRRLRAPSRPR